jgi:hypothetical protein
MNKVLTVGAAALFAALSIAATAGPAAAKNKHHHHGHGHWNHGGIVLSFGGLVYDDPDPIYCVDGHGRLFVCAYD